MRNEKSRKNIEYILAIAGSLFISIVIQWQQEAPLGTQPNYAILAQVSPVQPEIQSLRLAMMNRRESIREPLTLPSSFLPVRSSDR